MREATRRGTPINARIGERVLLARRRAGLTQEQLADQCSFTYQTISGLERGVQTVYAERLALIAQALDVSADYLLGLTDVQVRTP